MKLKDVRITYNLLDELEVQVPKDLLVYLADTIRHTEEVLAERRRNRMSDEDLITLENKQKRTLRINTPDGRLFQKKTNEETFRRILMEVDLPQVCSMGFMHGRKPFIIQEVTGKRRRIKGYAYLRDGYFLLAKSTTAEKVRLLNQVDERLQLNWDILVI